MKTLRTAFAAAVLCGSMMFATAGSALADGGAGGGMSNRERGREMSASHGDAVVTVKIVLTMSYAFGGQSGNDRESKNEVRGTVISPDGLIVTALTEIDPSVAFMQQMKSRMGPNDRFESKTKDLKIILADNKELQGAVVLRDPDLDLAFIRPIEKPASPMPYVDLSKGEAPKLLDSVFILGRMGELARRAPSAMTGEIQAIITKPRTFYIPSAELASSGLGVPAFTASGAPIGLVMVKHNAAAGEDDSQESSMVIVIPAADVADIAKQAPEKAPEEAAAPAAPATETKPESTEGEKPKSE